MGLQPADGRQKETLSQHLLYLARFQLTPAADEGPHLSADIHQVISQGRRRAVKLLCCSDHVRPCFNNLQSTTARHCLQLESSYG